MFILQSLCDTHWPLVLFTAPLHCWVRRRVLVVCLHSNRLCVAFLRSSPTWIVVPTAIACRLGGDLG